jgi:hypothetical protein
VNVEEEYMDVLQNMELAITTEYRRDPSLLDIYVLDAMNALIRQYDLEEQNRTPPKTRLNERSQRLFDGVRQMCEWRLGRSEAPVPGVEVGDPLNTKVILACLKRMRSSIDFWTKREGRQGYLKFVADYVS